jgi:hypothetical protein
MIEKEGKSFSGFFPDFFAFPFGTPIWFWEFRVITRIRAYNDSITLGLLFNLAMNLLLKSKLEY